MEMNHRTHPDPDPVQSKPGSVREGIDMEGDVSHIRTPDDNQLQELLFVSNTPFFKRLRFGGMVSGKSKNSSRVSIILSMQTLARYPSVRYCTATTL